MKKNITEKVILFLITILLFILITPTTVLGVSFNGKIETSTNKIRPGEEVEIKFYFQDYKDVENGINAYKATLDYDDNIFEDVNVANFKSQNSWQEFLYNENTHEFVAIKKAGSKDSEEVATIKLKAINNIQAGETTIKIKDIVASEGKEDITANDVEIKINLIANSDNNNSNVDGNNSNDNILNNENNDYDDTKTGILPYTGKGSISSFILIAIEILIVFAIFFKCKEKEITKKINKNIKILLMISCFGIISIQFATNVFAVAIKGELNDDGTIDYKDVTLLEQHLIHLKELNDNKKDAADMNYDGKLTVTDLSLLVKKIESNMDYTVTITSNLDNYYFNKNEEIEFKFTADVSNNAVIKSVTVNETDYTVERVNENSSEYIIKIKAQEEAGIQELKFTKATLDVGKEVNLNYTEKIEILKDTPSLENYTLEENIEEEKLIAKFDIIDNDESITNASVEIYNQNNEKIQTEDVFVGPNTIEISANENQKYKLNIYISYNLDTDSLKEHEKDNTGTLNFEKDLEFVGDYEFSIDNIQTYNTNGDNTTIFEKDETIVLSFDSTNVTSATPTKVKINGQEYDVKEKDKKYIAEISGISEIGDKTLNIEEITLSNGKKIKIENTIVNVTINKKSPSINNVSFTENTDINKLQLKFNIKDDDNTILNIKYLITDDSNDVIAEKVIVGNYEINDEIDLTNIISKNYTLKIVATYNNAGEELTDKVLYTDTINAKDRVIIKNGEISKTEIEKNEEITLTYTIETNKEENIEKIIVNNIEKDVIQKDGKYSVTIFGGNIAGIKNIIVTAIIFQDNVEVKADYTNSVEVLKDKPSISNFNATYNYDEKKVNFDFDLQDNDKALISAKSILVKQDSTIWKETEINVDKNNYNLDVDENIEYTFEILASYSRYENGENIVTDEVIFSKPIQMIKEYNLEISNIKTYTNQNSESKYFDKNEEFIVLFESTNSSDYYIERAVINGKEYDVKKLNDNYYEICVDSFDSSGVKEIKIEKVTLSNAEEIEVTENNTTKIEILKEKPSIDDFEYTQSNDETITLAFKLVDTENSIKTVSITISDENGQVIETKEDIKTGLNEITFNTTNSEKYLVKIVSDYDLDTNGLEEGSNEYTNQEILNQEITIVQELIEFKDIESIKLYKKENENVVEEIEVNVLDFKPEDYIIEVTMKDLPKFYAEIKDTKIEDGKFMLILDYDNVVQYEGEKKSNTLEVKFGEINENNIASNLSFEELIERINSDPTGEFELTQDLDASVLTATGSTIITTEFKGKLNGNGYTIKNLNKPLFNTLSEAEITNLVIDDANISGSNNGILSNYATNSIISNVHITNSTITTSHTNGTGGFIGKIENKSLIEKSSATNIKVSGGKRVGGFVGYLNGGSTIDNCYITGSVSGSNDAIGGISGQDSGISTIQNCYANIQYNVVNNWSNGGIAGYSDSSSLILNNNISLADGEVGTRIIGTGYNSKSSNNYEISESNLSSNANGNRIKEISKNDINQEFFEEQLNWDNSIWRFDNLSDDNLPTLKNDDPEDIENKQNEVDEDKYIPDINRLQNMDNYQSNKEIVYNNIYQLMPFYDAKYIVYYGNKIEENNLLNQSKIKTIIPYDNNGEMIVGLNSNNYNKIVKIRIVFENEQTVDYSITFDKKINDIAVYNINDLGIKYNYNQFILNTNISTLQTIVNKAKSLDYTSEISSVTTETESRLYTDYYNESVQGKLDKIILEILENTPEYNLYLDNEILKTKIENDLLSDSKLEKILYTYNYFDKWYHMEIGGIPLTNIIFTKVNELNDDYSILSLTRSTIGQAENTRKTSNTVTFFNNVIKPELGDKGIGAFLEYFMKVLEGYDDGTEWFADHFQGILNEKPAVGKEETIRYRAWELLKARNNLLLPILSAPQEDMYIISVPSQLVIGSMNRYGQYTSGDIEGMKQMIEEYATKIGNFYGISATFINNSESILNSHAHIQYDTRFNFPTGDQNSGTTEDPVIKWVYEAVGSFAAQNGSGAYANGTDVYWVAYHALGSDFTFRVFTHETAHNQDGYYFYEGYGRRSGTGAEDHADSNISQDLGDGSLVFNVTGDRDITSDDSNNLTLERIIGADNIYTYYKEMFETYYVLDYLTAQAFLELTPEEQARVAVQVTYDGGTDYEKGGATTIYKQISADEFRKMNLQDMEDLWDNGIALRGAGTVTGSIPGSYGGDNHYSIYWYQPHNNSGRPDSYSFKRLGFEMLGVAGYSNGYVTYRSGKSSNDLDALRKVTGDDNITWKEYKLNRYTEVEENLSRIPYFDTNSVIEAYKEALKKDAINGNRNNTNNLRKVLYGIVKRTTKDFTTGTIYGIDEEIEITSAEQFIEVLNSAEWGNYKITKDLDFSNIKTEGDSYISNIFVGRIDGNGYTIIGLTKPLFSQVTYGAIQNLTINEPNYSENDEAILTITAKQILIDNVVVNNSNVKLPFVKTSQGVIQWLGTTAINVKENEINNLEDLINISNNSLTRKMNYKLNTDIDVSSILGNSAILSGEFTGNLNGNNHKIYNLNIPLFDNLKGTINNLKLENMNFNSSGTSSVGALARTSESATVENIKVNNVTINGRENLAGLVGVATNSTFNKISVDNINITGPRYYIGGIIGRSTNVTLSNARVTGKISIQATHNGGVIGAMNSGKMENVYANVEIARPNNTDSRNQNGGLIGSLESGNPTIKNCISIGYVAEDVYKAIGGINGKTAGELTDKKDYINNVYENSEATGISNTNEDNNIRKIDENIYSSKTFYIETLGWSQEIWDLNNMENGPNITF